MPIFDFGGNCPFTTGVSNLFWMGTRLENVKLPGGQTPLTSYVLFKKKDHMQYNTIILKGFYFICYNFSPSINSLIVINDEQYSKPFLHIFNMKYETFSY